jgi:hypothetical protein
MASLDTLYEILTKKTVNWSRIMTSFATKHSRLGKLPGIVMNGLNYCKETQMLAEWFGTKSALN